MVVTGSCFLSSRIRIQEVWIVDWFISLVVRPYPPPPPTLSGRTTKGGTFLRLPLDTNPFFFFWVVTGSCFLSSRIRIQSLFELLIDSCFQCTWISHWYLLKYRLKYIFYEGDNCRHISNVTALCWSDNKISWIWDYFMEIGNILSILNIVEGNWYPLSKF